MRSDLEDSITVHLAEHAGSVVGAGYSLSRSPEPIEISEPAAHEIEERTPPPGSP